MKSKRSTNKAIMKKYSQGSREAQEKQKNDKKNVPVLVITYFVIFIFIGMMVHLVKYVVVDADSDIANSYNKRQNLYAETVIKGQIISDDGVVLAETKPEFTHTAICLHMQLVMIAMDRQVWKWFPIIIC